MEKQPNLFLMLSLREIALRRVPVILWNDPAILNILVKFRFNPLDPGSERPFLKTLECRVADKMSKLWLPESLKKQMMPVLKVIGWEILKWITFHSEHLNSSNEDFDSSILQKLCWTIAATVDYRKTAESLMCCDVLDIMKRFNLACLHCLESYILEFWKELPSKNKSTIIKEKVETPDMQMFLPYILKRFCNISNLPPSTDLIYSFVNSALYGNKALVEYCFKKLTKMERVACLVSIPEDVLILRNSVPHVFLGIGNLQFSDIFYYLLSVMTPAEQIRIFKKSPCEILLCFLTWPWQDLFLEIADVIWTFLPETEYKRLVQKMMRIIYKSDHYFPNFFQNLFLQSPSNFRKSFVNEECRLCLMSKKFFNRDDTETIKVIFRNVDAADRLRLVSSKPNLKFIYHQSPRKWHINAEYLQAAHLSKKDKEKVKEDFIEHVKSKEGQIEVTDPRWIELFEFLDEPNPSAEIKRKSEDETFRKAFKKSAVERRKILLSH